MTKMPIKNVKKNEYYFIVNAVLHTERLCRHLYSKSGGFSYFDVDGTLWVHKTSRFDKYVCYELSHDEVLEHVVLPNL